MRRVIVAAVLVVAGNAGSAGAQPLCTLDDPIGILFVPDPLPACAIGTAILRLQEAATILIGFERSPDARKIPTGFPILAVRYSTICPVGIQRRNGADGAIGKVGPV